MIELNNVTYVVNNVSRIPMLVSVLGCKNEEQYVCCGESRIVDYNTDISYYVDKGESEQACIRSLTWDIIDDGTKWEYLHLYGYKIPKKTVVYRPFTHNPESALKRDRQFVLVCTKKTDLFSFAKLIEKQELNPEQCYVVFLSSFSENEIKEGDSLMPFSEAMTECMDDFNIRGWHAEGREHHFKDIVWLQSCLKMSNVQMAMFFGIKLRTIENWRAKPSSMPDYAWRYFIQSCFSMGSYLEERYGADVKEILSEC